MEIESIGTYNIVQSAIKHNIKKIIYASTSGVYGKTEIDQAVNENFTVSPSSSYAIAKRFNELDKDRNIFVMSHTGTRSQTVVKWLKNQGYKYSVNVLGGIDAWAALIDRNIRRY